MKKLVILLLTSISAFILTNCDQQADAESILNKPETKQEVFSTIIEDHQLMTDFMDQMMQSEHGMMMMKEHEGMQNMMMDGENMMSMMKDNPDMMNNMMGSMMQDGNMMKHMMQVMNEKGMMSDECLQSCMNMMKDQGMMMGNGMME